jgi:hypothetical protein
MPLTWGLLQGWQDVEAMVILSLLCFIWAGRTLLGFCLLTCTFRSLISSGSGRTSNEFQPCSKPCSLCEFLQCVRYTMKRNEFAVILLLASTLSISCRKPDSLENRIEKIKNNKSEKKTLLFENGQIQEISDISDDTLVYGSKFIFTTLGKLENYYFQIDTTYATYNIRFNVKGEILGIYGSPLIYSYTTPDIVKDSMWIKKYFSSFLYDSIKVEVAGNDGAFKQIRLKNEEDLNFVESFQLTTKVSDINRFVFMTKFSGTRIDNGERETFYDTIDLTRRTQLP